MSQRTVFLVVLLACATAALAEPGEFSFHRDHILGTSLDLTVLADSEADAKAAEGRVLVEIERLRRILSTWDPKSEISALNATASPVKCSAELVEVLSAAETWRVKSGGAFSVELGDLLAAWSAAARSGTPPQRGKMQELADRILGPPCQIDAKEAMVRRLTRSTLNVDGLAKGYIIDKALAAAGAGKGPIHGAMLNIGGDIAVAGQSIGDAGKWRIGVADPRRVEDNAPLLTELDLNRGAIASSGHAARAFKVGDHRYGQILNPLTGWPADGVIGATVVAGDCMSADALATTLCVLPPLEGVRLARSLPGVEAIILSTDGKTYHTPGWTALQVHNRPATSAQEAQRPERTAVGGVWPAGYQVTISLTLADLARGRRKAHRPYVVVWVEDARGNPLRTLAIWGDETKYLKELSTWYRYARKDSDLIRRVSRASRSPGAYTLAWDGTDDKGKRVPAGSYTVRIELDREKGQHVTMSGRIDCGDKPATGSMTDTADVTGVRLIYGPAGEGR